MVGPCSCTGSTRVADGTPAATTQRNLKEDNDNRQYRMGCESVQETREVDEKIPAQSQQNTALQTRRVFEYRVSFASPTTLHGLRLSALIPPLDSATQGLHLRSLSNHRLHIKARPVSATTVMPHRLVPFDVLLNFAEQTVVILTIWTHSLAEYVSC